MVQSAQTQQQLYSHAAEPKAVTQRRAKYRPEEEQQGPYNANIMFDRRVVRGNTYAARILPAESTLNQTKPTGTGTKKKSVRSVPPRTPEAVDGRRHIDIQTDVYLEELTDTVPESDNNTQTDAFLDRPPTPLFVPQKTGLDATTQIAAGDLFDFDFEVEPILEVLVGKVLEQGLMEVLEEEELAAMRSHQEHFEQIRNAELVATQRMEAAEKRKLEEKERRMAQERERVERERVVRQKVAASAFARGYLGGIVNTVFDRLQTSGFFFDPVQREVETSFLPWLKEQAVDYLSQGVVARKVVQKLVEDATAALVKQREAAAAASASGSAAVDAWAEREAAGAAKNKEVADEDTTGKGAYVLALLQASQAENIEATRKELQEAAELDATTKYEEAKAAAADKAREEAEAKLAAQQEKLEELKAAAEEAYAELVAKAEENEEEPPPQPEEPTLDEPLVVVEEVVAEAEAAVEKPEVKEITDDDIMSTMLDKGLITKDNVTQALALDSLGEGAYNYSEPAPPPAAPPA